MAYPAGSFIEVKVEYTVNEQKCMNVLHYVPGTPGVGPVRTLQDQFLLTFAAVGPGTVLTSMAALMGNNTAINRITCQTVFPQRYRISEIDVDVPGVIVSPISRQNTGLTLTKRGDLGNRHNVGTFHLGGMPDSTFLLGEINPVLAPQVGDLANALKDDVADLVAGITYIPVIANKTKVPDTDPPKYQFSGFTVITDVDVPDFSARVMRRRTLRIGI